MKFIFAVSATLGAALEPSPRCANEPAKSAKWCDHTAPLEERVSALVANLTLAEKSNLVTNTASGIPRINWPVYDWWSEGLHGAARDGVATSFPQIIGVASSLNRTLWKAMAEVISTEGRGLNNDLRGARYQGLTFWSPNINIFRDPRWGRGQETPGEDPTINSEYGVEFVTGMQGDDEKYLKVSACIKHYAAYSLEEGRNSFPAMVTAQDMEDTYLPAFEAGVKRGKASSIMCSYNAESYGYGIFGNGSQGAIPSCANKYLLNDLARDTWGFDGYITSDCGATRNVIDQHKYTSTPADTINAVLQAGMDSDCGVNRKTSRFSQYMTPETVQEVVNSGEVDEALIDVALKNLFRVQFRLGFADPPSLVPFAEVGAEVVDTAAHRALARDAAEQSFVLLKNDGTLPLTETLRLAVIGRNANATFNMQGNYFGDAPFLVSPLEGLSKTASSVVYDDGSDIEAAVRKVAEVDAVVLVVGLTSEGVKPEAVDEAEDLDRKTLVMPLNQSSLIAEVSAAAGGKPVVLVIMSGGAVDVSAAKADVAVGAMMWVGYPGQSGGDAIADAIFGRTNRFGKLTQTWYPESFAQQVDVADMGMRPNSETGNLGRSHRFYNGPTIFKFGDGLSYTDFSNEIAVTEPMLSADELAAELRTRPTSGRARVFARVNVSVTNTGSIAGDCVVMLFVAAPDDVRGIDGAPLQSLVGFDRVRLAAGASIASSFDLTWQHVSYASSDGEFLSPDGTWQVWTGNADAPGNRATLKLEGQRAIV